jgi:hypothetical protein
LVEVVPGSGREDAPSAVKEVSPAVPRRIVGVSARTMTDEVIWEMWAQLFESEEIVVESVGSAYLSSETTITGDKARPDLICVNSIPPGGLAQARYICRRLRAKLPRATIVVIRPGVQEDEKESAKRLLEDGANIVCATLEEARTAADHLLVASRNRPADVIADPRTVAL